MIETYSAVQKWPASRRSVTDGAERPLVIPIRASRARGASWAVASIGETRTALMSIPGAHDVLVEVEVEVLGGQRDKSVHRRLGSTVALPRQRAFGLNESSNHRI